MESRYLKTKLSLILLLILQGVSSASPNGTIIAFDGEKVIVEGGEHSAGNPLGAAQIQSGSQLINTGAPLELKYNREDNAGYAYGVRMADKDSVFTSKDQELTVNVNVDGSGLGVAIAPEIRGSNIDPFVGGARFDFAEAVHVNVKSTTNQAGNSSYGYHIADVGNVVRVGDGSTITLDSGKSSAYAIFLRGDNQFSSGQIKIDVQSQASEKGRSSSYAIYSQGDATIGQGSIISLDTFKDAYGIYSSGTKSHFTADDDLVVNMSSKEGSSTGFVADKGGELTVANNAKLIATTHSKGLIQGIGINNKNTRIKIGDKAIFELSGKGSVYGVYGSEGSVSLGDLTSMQLQSKDSTTFGVWVRDGAQMNMGNNTEIFASGKNFYALVAQNSSEITMGDNTKIVARGYGSSGNYGLFSSNDSAIILGRESHIDVAGNGDVYGVLGNSGAHIELGSQSTINVENKDGKAIGVQLGSANPVDALVNFGKGSVINVRSVNGNAYGILISGEGNKVQLKGATLVATNGEEVGSGSVFNVQNKGVLIGNLGKYKILGSIMNYGGDIELNLDEGSYFKGYSRIAKTKREDVKTDLYLTGSYWDVTSDSEASLLHFNDAQSEVSFVNTEGFNLLKIGELSGDGGQFNMRSAIAEGRGDYLFVVKGTGSHKVNVTDSGAEITAPTETQLDLITDESGGADFTLVDLKGVNIRSVDGGTYMYSLGERDDNAGKIWYLSAEKKVISKPEDENSDSNKHESPTTTPATDAVISIAMAPYLIMDNEINNLRFRRGSLNDSIGDMNIWTRMIGDTSKINRDHSHFDLKQLGLEVGADKNITLNSGTLYLGTFASYSHSDIKHKRGGKSKIETVGLGLYATYFHNSGFYLDGIMKYSHFNNDLRANSTQGYRISGDYSQSGYGLSAELGYNWQLDSLWIEPYGRLTYLKIDGEDLSLSNGMKAKLNSFESFSSELGISIGKDFNLVNNTLFSPYGKVAWRHEFVGDNKVFINDRHQFINDISGDVLKVGVGFNAKFQNNLVLYGEVNYRKGSYLKSSYQGNIGIRFDF